MHGICGRGVLVDLVRYYTSSPDGKLPYDPWTTHAITVTELEACAAKQGVKFRQGDILIIRAGFIQKYMNSSVEAREALGGKPETLSVARPHTGIHFVFFFLIHVLALGSSSRTI